MRSLTELALDGNAVVADPKYRATVIEALPGLRHLDLKRVSEEERRHAHLLMKKEEEKLQACFVCSPSRPAPIARVHRRTPAMHARVARYTCLSRAVRRSACDSEATPFCGLSRAWAGVAVPSAEPALPIPPTGSCKGGSVGVWRACRSRCDASTSRRSD